MTRKPRNKGRVTLGIGLIVFGFGLLGRLLQAHNPFGPFGQDVTRFAVRAAMYGGALIVLYGAAAIWRDEKSSDL